MKKIHNIIESELVVRTNNIKFSQEFGELGKSANITNESNSTIFTTEFGIEKILSLTVNGVGLVEGIHYYVKDEFYIYISNQGDPLNAFSGQDVNILVAYIHNKNKFGVKIVQLPPVISTFYIDKYSGRDEKIIFDFIIEERNGKNIYWSILKDGSDTPIFSGAGLTTTSGHIIDSSGNLVELAYYVTNDEYLERVGQDMYFTLVVVYDLTDDGSRLDEKLLASTKYSLLDFTPITGSITSVPEYISSSGTHDIAVDFNIINPSGEEYSWEVTMSNNGAAEVTLDSGHSSEYYSGTITDQISAIDGDSFYHRYYLRTKGPVDASFVEISNDRTTVVVPIGNLDAVAGYLDEAVMNYYSSSLGAWTKIGDLGSAQDLVEYSTRVPRDIFTATVIESDLNSGAYIQASVYNPAGTIAKVYFVIEVPKAWGEISFYQPTGEVDISAFNKIDLENGYDAYLYNVSSSSSTNPSDYTLKRI